MTNSLYFFRYQEETLHGRVRGNPSVTALPISFVTVKGCVSSLSPHLYSLRGPSLLHSEGLSLFCLPHMPSVIPLIGHLRYVSLSWRTFTFSHAQ